MHEEKNQNAIALTGATMGATVGLDAMSNEFVPNSSRIGKMKRMANPINASAKRMCFNDDTKLDSSFPDDPIPPHHFHLGEDIYAAVTYFATRSSSSSSSTSIQKR
ncbi:hypothetical protein NPIL_85571 [Nephila pilipes]|uniref:Uncharacterized protein n=1 Tax=Nephila pilipes TaxID=299642 RepID=A0A8X6QYW0_NEPPI|nr:hypothetical protein NPIL_85571 [Nephila pilipes]